MKIELNVKARVKHLRRRCRSHLEDRILGARRRLIERTLLAGALVAALNIAYGPTIKKQGPRFLVWWALLVDGYKTPEFVREHAKAMVGTQPF